MGKKRKRTGHCSCNWLQRKDLGSHKVQLSGSCYAWKLRQHRVHTSKGEWAWQYSCRACIGGSCCGVTQLCTCCLWQEKFWAKSMLTKGLFQGVLSALPSEAFLFLTIKCFLYWSPQVCSKRKWSLKTGFAWGLGSGPDPILSFPHQSFAHPLSFRDRLLCALAQKSRGVHPNTLVWEMCSAHNSKRFCIWFSERKETSMRCKQGLGCFYNIFLCPILRSTYSCKYISYLSSVNSEPWGAVILSHLLGQSSFKKNLWADQYGLLHH